MSEREELAQLVSDAYDRHGYVCEDGKPDLVDFDAADTILAAGYKKLRIVATSEDLDALPNGAAVKTILRGRPVGRTWGKVEGNWWGLALEDPTYPVLPAAVIWEG